tara:strand:- start:349 stop:504 length:156 start_codon:yes stop_codon:yes gene_type:complete
MLRSLYNKIKLVLNPKRTPEILPRKKVSLPAMERRIAASRNIVDGSLMDKE